MLFTKIAPIAALAVSAAAEMVEIIDGYTYRLSGPVNEQPKIEYEMHGARTALALLKERIGPDGLVELLQPDIADADAYWHDAIARSSGDKWVDASGRGLVFLPNLTAELFAAWSLSPFSDAANNAANPEHYLRRTKVVDGVATSEILEGWGGITTHFTIEDYGLPDREQYPFLNDLPDFPIQAAGRKTLLDGTTFGILHISIRNVPGEKYGEDQDGIEIFASVWYGNGVDDEHLDVERGHIITEIVNLTLQAQRDIEDGLFPPSN